MKPTAARLGNLTIVQTDGDSFGDLGKYEASVPPRFNMSVIPPFLMKLVMLNVTCHFLMANDFGEKPAENYSSKITSLALFLFFALERALRVL